MHLQQVQRGGRFSPFDPFPSTEQDFLHVVFEKRVPFAGFVHTKTFTFQDDILFLKGDAPTIIPVKATSTNGYIVGGCIRGLSLENCLATIFFLAKVEQIFPKW